MYTLEQKVNLIMEYIVEDDCTEKIRLREKIMQALCERKDTGAMDMDGSIDNLLKEIGAPCHPIGYDQLKYAIKLVMLDKTYVHSITGRLYPDVAKEFNSTPIRVERNIRKVITAIFDGQYGSDNAYDLFKNSIARDRGKPTNSQFIIVCVRELERRMRE